MGVMSNAASWVDFSVPTAVTEEPPSLAPPPPIALTRPRYPSEHAGPMGGIPTGRSLGPARA